MSIKDIERNRREWLETHRKYKLRRWDIFDYSVLDLIMEKYPTGKGDKLSYSDCIIMADTETSKKETTNHNHVVAWTISIRAFDLNICTLWGQKPSDFISCLKEILQHLKGDEVFVYFHNLQYDYVFLRKFLYKAFGYPESQLNTKPHYPIYIKMGRLVLKDSLILAQRSLDKWSIDMDVEHKKAMGKWDYDKLRNQCDLLTDDELEYIEHDTLAGVECIQKMINELGKNIRTIPYTATGIPREDVRKIGIKNRAKDRFNRQKLTLEQYLIMEQVFHGGYTHANRFYIERVIKEDTHGIIKAFDFSSSYPYVMLTSPMPMEKFHKEERRYKISEIEAISDKYACVFKLIMVDVTLKDKFNPMPYLQSSKAIKTVNPYIDNGRILAADYVEIYLNEIDVKIIREQYHFSSTCVDVNIAKKALLPKWFRDYIFKCFVDKTKLKGGDPVAYSIAKSKLNSLFGMSCQSNIKPEIEEDYISGKYTTRHDVSKDVLYDKYTSKWSCILPFQWGAYITSWSAYNLFQLGKCCGTWLYSDTDSCYGFDWDIQKVDEYNNKCIEAVKNAGYHGVEYNGKTYHLGVAELDGVYSEFVTCGAKRYAVKKKDSGEIKITVAGVPKKKGSAQLKSLEDFKAGFIFDGEKTGKLTHTYIYVDDIYVDESGNETGDSIDLTPCDYLLDSVYTVNFDNMYDEKIAIQVYEDIENERLFI